MHTRIWAFVSITLLFANSYSMQNYTHQITLEQIQRDPRYKEVRSLLPDMRCFEMVIESHNGHKVEGLMFDEQGRPCGDYTNDHESELIHNGVATSVEDVQNDVIEPSLFTEPLIPEHVFLNQREIDRQPEQRIRNNQHQDRRTPTVGNKKRFAYGATIVGIGMLAYLLVKLCSNDKDTASASTKL